MVNSPSDTTIYVPALKKVANQQVDVPFTVDNISKFIEGIRVQPRKVGTSEEVHNESTDESVNQQPQPETSRRAHEEMAFEETRHKAERAIIEAEQFKANITLPQGNSVTVNDNKFYEGDVKDDDNFFHITCHMDPSLVNKISHGEFVDLEKLLPKQKGGYVASYEQKTELVFREGKPVFLPYVDKGKIINGVRRWEQAFRIYAAIYSQANTQRSAEIWQYVFIINTAASSYAWNNVAEYDFAFRHMMAKNPKRSWSKVYTQMWNIYLTEPNTRSNFNNRAGFSGYGNSQKGNNNKNQGSAKPNYCWKYNKNGKCKFGNNCHFVNRCSYCDAGNHGLYNCPRKAEATNSNTDNN